MRHKMKVDGWRELLSVYRAQYSVATRREKRKLIDDFVLATEYHPKYVNALLRGEDAPPGRPSKRGGRPRCYDAAVEEALIFVWRAMNRVCGKRLVPFIVEMLFFLKRSGDIKVSEAVEKSLLSLSAATADRILSRERRREEHGLSTTRPGNLLRKQVLVRTFNDWGDLRPGFLEIDCVCHCDRNASGQFLCTLSLTDVATGWVVLFPMLNRNWEWVKIGLGYAQSVLPFPILGLDSDNGSEFMNRDMIAYCDLHSIEFTRSRPYKKNDQAHIEERNGAVVRRLAGHGRYEGEEARLALLDLYEAVQPFQNYFQPIMKLIRRAREGGRVTKQYDTPQTPLQRLLEWDTLGQEAKERQRAVYLAQNPVALLGRIARHQEAFHAHGWKAPSASDIPSPSIMTLEAIRAHSAQRRKEKAQQAPAPLIAGVPVQSCGISLPKSYALQAKPRRKQVQALDVLWSEVEAKLRANPFQAVDALFKELQREYPGIFPDDRITSVVRKVRDWRRSLSRPVGPRPKDRPLPRTSKELWQEAEVLLQADPFLSAPRLSAELSRLFGISIPTRTLVRRLSKWREQHHFDAETGQLARKVDEAQAEMVSMIMEAKRTAQEALTAAPPASEAFAITEAARSSEAFTTAEAARSSEAFTTAEAGRSPEAFTITEAARSSEAFTTTEAARSSEAFTVTEAGRSPEAFTITEAGRFTEAFTYPTPSLG